MVKRPLALIAVSAVALFAAAGQAVAGCCPGCDCAPGTVVEVFVSGPKSYLVEQGPVYSGPGAYAAQIPDRVPRKFPYVGFVFSGYPYGYYDAYVGAPRRFYRPR